MKMRLSFIILVCLAIAGCSGGASKKLESDIEAIVTIRKREITLRKELLVNRSLDVLY